MSIKSDDDAIEAGTRLLDMGVKAVLMKGGHVEGKPVFVTDWLMEQGREPVALRQPHVDTENTHGTGCTLSAAIASQLGFGMPLRIAVTRAQEFLNLALRHSFAPGKGAGPVNHMAGLKK
jgi:hydroxymethylpyrimidine/phosphomethylpyrimidine kinase